MPFTGANQNPDPMRREQALNNALNNVTSSQQGAPTTPVTPANATAEALARMQQNQQIPNMTDQMRMQYERQRQQELQRQQMMQQQQARAQSMQGQPVTVQQPTPPPSSAVPPQYSNVPPSSAVPLNQTTMQQGASYNPNGVPNANAGQNVGAVPQANVPNSNNQSDSNGKPGFSLNPKMILIIVGIVIVFIIVYIILSGMQSGKVPEEESLPSEEDFEWVMPEEQVFKYTSEQIEKLRAVGYTGDEIELHQEYADDFDALIKDAEDARQAYIDEALATVQDNTSDEYKAYIGQTWLPLAERTDMQTFENIGMYYSQRVNVDYEKVPVHGNQLMIKLYLDDDNHDNYVFCIVTPEEWLSLKDYGNVIANYTYCTSVVDDGTGMLVEDLSRIFITEIYLEII